MLKVFFLCLALLAPGLARAQTCSFTVTNVDFGSPAVVSGGVVDTTATLTGTCTNYAATNFCLAFDAGSGGSSGTARFMTGPAANTLKYNLYQDAARTVPWGSRPTPALGTIPYRTLTGASNFTYTTTAYARLQAGQSTAALGSYSSSFSGTQAEVYSLTSGTNCLSGPAGPSIYGTFSVLATVGSDCTVTASSLNFGAMGLINANVDVNTTLTVACTSTTAYTVGLGNGLTGTGPTTRKLKSGANAITYGLYRDAARAQAWSTTAGNMGAGTGNGAGQAFTVYGRVFASQTPPAGSYSDTVGITVTY